MVLKLNSLDFHFIKFISAAPGHVVSEIIRVTQGALDPLLSSRIVTSSHGGFFAPSIISAKMAGTELSFKNQQRRPPQLCITMTFKTHMMQAAGYIIRYH